MHMLLAGLVLLGTSAQAEPELLASGGEIELLFNTGILEPFGIEVRSEGMRAMMPPVDQHGYLGIRYAGSAGDQLQISAPELAMRGFAGGRLKFDGILELVRGSRRVRLNGFYLAGSSSNPIALDLLDDDGRVWMRLDYIHFELMADEESLSLRYMDLRVTPALAVELGVPQLSNERIGAAFATAPIVARAEDLVARSSCTVDDANWPTEPDYEADIAMTHMGTPSFRRCQGCNGSSGGPMVIVPDATLKNVGTADVPWWVQFSGNFPPYGNDQHPFLIWNLYRLSADGQLEMIAASGLKHAFFTINIGPDCACPGGQILWSQCEDIYGAASNDMGVYLAPRNEIVPHAGLWGRCHSFFDPDCSGSQSQSSGSYDNRLLVMESEINPAAHPGARFFLDAWYVTRDDENIFNSMGWQEITPTWNGMTWTFPVSDGMTQGAVIDHWVDPLLPAMDQLSTLVETDTGTIKVAVHVEDLGDGTWRYDYAVANFDFMRASIAGSEPDLEVTDSQGLIAFEVPARSNVEILATQFSRADRLTGQDWTVETVNQKVRWSDPGDTPLDWGLLFRFSLVADHPPVRSEFKLAFGADPSEFVGAATLAPSPSIFADRFQP
jgi:hypothetical protein